LHGGPGRSWRSAAAFAGFETGKTKCPDWKRENAERYRIFEQPKKRAMSEEEKALKSKRAELG